MLFLHFGVEYLNPVVLLLEDDLLSYCCFLELCCCIAIDGNLVVMLLFLGAKYLPLVLLL